MSNQSEADEFAASRARELLAEAQQRLWGAMYYVRNNEAGITEIQLKRAIMCVEKLQHQLITSAERSAS